MMTQQNNKISLNFSTKVFVKSDAADIALYGLKKVSNRLSLAEKIANIGYWEVCLETHKIYWSAELYNLLGVSTSKPNTHWHIIRRFVYKQDIPIYVKKLRRLIRTEEPANGQFRVKRSDGKLIYCNYKAEIIYDDGERKIAGILQDVTEQVTIQKELEKAKKAADKSNLEKSYFLAQASHDLRQPMIALDMFIQAMFNLKLTKKQHNILSNIDASADNLKNLLDNLLDISKLDSNGVKYEPVRFNIGELLTSIADEYRQLANLKNIKFHALVHKGMACSDPILVERIIRNLLSNAFKYTNDKIVLGCKRAGNNFRIMVLDNGPGISEEEQIKVFEEFYQSPSNKDNKKHGAGLGLSIVRKIAKIIGSTIHINSIMGQGTCFSFYVPITCIYRRAKK